MFDKRGTGLSDPISQVQSLEQRMDDVRAVMDAGGFKGAAVLGVSEGGALTALFAAAFPERCKALALCGAFARSPFSPRRSTLFPDTRIAPGVAASVCRGLRRRAKAIPRCSSGGAALRDWAEAQQPPWRS
jgi:pimeloyl-ACP methyl ester carboxylesterase